MTNHQIDHLMSRIQSGDGTALAELYESMSKPVFFYALRLCGNFDAAQDVMQDTFVTLMRKSSLYRAEDKGRAWLFTVARNLVVDMQRRQSRTDDFSVITEMPGADDCTVQTDTEIDALRMLEGLSAREKNIVLLRLLGDMTLTEVAAELNIPKGSVFWTYNNAVKKMRKQYTGGEHLEEQV